MTILNAHLIDDIRKHPDGRVDLIGLFEDLYLDALPVLLENLSLFVDLHLDPEDRGAARELELRVLGPDLAVVQTSQIKFTVPPIDAYPRDTAQLDLALFEIPFHHYGPYRIDIASQGARLRSIPFRVLPASG